MAGCDLRIRAFVDVERAGGDLDDLHFCIALERHSPHSAVGGVEIQTVAVYLRFRYDMDGALVGVLRDVVYPFVGRLGVVGVPAWRAVAGLRSVMGVFPLLTFPQKREKQSGEK